VCEIYFAFFGRFLSVRDADGMVFWAPEVADGLGEQNLCQDEAKFLKLWTLLGSGSDIRWASVQREYASGLVFLTNGNKFGGRNL
jgi:hypothetical protein